MTEHDNTSTLTTSSSIPLNSLSQYPDVLSGSSSEEGILLNDPLSKLESLRALERFTSQHRAALVSALNTDLQKWNAPASALAAAGELLSPGSYAVVTGQQAGIATGPLYTLYKAIGAVRAAHDLAELFPDHRFVPVFWIEADDHDFDEARTLALFNRSGEPATFSYDDGVARPLHVGDRGVDADAIGTLVESLREALLPTEFTDQALGVLSNSYLPGETLADGFARSIYTMLGDTPLVVASSRNPALKRLAEDIFASEADDPTALFNAVHARTEQLKNSGVQTPIALKPGALFITHEGERRALDYHEDGYTVRGTDQRLSFQEAAAMAREHPEKFSPNVVLRPIVQDAIFPTALYLGGPSEVAYLRQIRSGYQVFGLDASAVIPRPFMMLLEAKVRRTMESVGVQMQTLLQEHFDAADFLIDHELDRELDAARERALTKLEEAYRELESVTHRIDPTLEKTLGAAGSNATKGVEDFTKRLRSALKKKQEGQIDKLESARTLLLPNGKLQERLINPLYYINKYGLMRFREVLAKIELSPGEMQVVEM